MKLKENENGKKKYLFIHITMRVRGAFNNASWASLNKTQGLNSRLTQEFQSPTDITAHNRTFNVTFQNNESSSSFIPTDQDKSDSR